MNSEHIRDEFRIYQEIPPVELRVASSPTSAGKVEKYDSANRLMRRLDAIGRAQRIILSLTEGGQPLPQAHVDALNHYLHACKGLRSFRRVATAPVFTKYGWGEFRDKLNIPTLAVLVSV